MRAVIVSAHYPPDFVSGGTLVPQRIARGLAARGHDVSVYAGSLDPAVAPLTTWDESDGHGVGVRWISTHPWTGWSDVTTYDNPEVAEDFGSWADTIRPDVVHLHSLQSLGVGVLEAAAATGARVVLTAHDFWWQCARQFLVDRGGRPCSLVVRAGSCACEAGREWLQERDHRIAAALRCAHVVLAPSASAARVLVANGVDPVRVRVDENGVPAAQVPAQPVVAAAAGRGPVRFLFTGGADPMKGWPVLAAALRAMAGTTGWTLSAYGVAASGHPARLPLAVTVHPPYLPDELAAVMAAHDVLVLPSLMRESHSLVTREALTAGLTVVCTDSLGPEEVVEHGRNGLVVPAADAGALAATLSSLAADPARVAALRSAPLPLVRAVEDQVLGLESLYATLLAAPELDRGEALAVDPSPGSPPIPLPEPLAAPLGRPPAATTAPGGAAAGPGVHRVLFLVGIQGAPLRYRALLPAAGLRQLGCDVEVRWYRDPEVPVLAAAADAVVAYRVPATWQLLAVLDEVRGSDRAVPLVFDVDDLIFDPDLRGEVKGLAGLSQAEADLWWRGVARYRTTMEACDLYVGSTTALCDHAARVTGMPTRRFANGVGTLMGEISDAALQRPRRSGPLRIGYFSGTTTHDEDWAAVEPAVLQVMAAHPRLELWLGGHLRPTPALRRVSRRVRRVPMLPWHELPGLLRDVDVNLAPLLLVDGEHANRFNEAKSAIKWSEAALVATPTVASPTEPFRELVTDGVSGFLASSHEDWVRALDGLVSSEADRARIGSIARREALLRLSPDLQARSYLGILQEARRLRAEHGPRTGTSGWQAVADDEPWEPTAVESYALPPPAPTVTQRFAETRVAGLAGRVRTVYAEGGAGEVLSRGWGAAARRLSRR